MNCFWTKDTSDPNWERKEFRIVEERPFIWYYLLELWYKCRYEGSAQGSLNCLPPMRMVSPVSVQSLGCGQVWFRQLWLRRMTAYVHINFQPLLLHFYCCWHLLKEFSFYPRLLVLAIPHQSRASQRKILVEEL